MHPWSRVLRGCSALLVILPPSLQLFKNDGLSVPFSYLLSRKQWKVRWWGTTVMEKRKVWVGALSWCSGQVFVAKVLVEVFAHFHAVAVKRRSGIRNWLFGLSGRILCEQSPWCQINDEHAPDLAPHLSHLFRFLWVLTFRVRLMLSLPNACLITARFSVVLFRDLYTIWSCSFVGSIAKSHQARYTTPNKRTDETLDSVRGGETSLSDHLLTKDSCPMKRER
jgi:hypothetical protein